MENVTFKLTGMSCSCEGSIVEKRVKKLRGVESYVLNPFTYAAAGVLRSGRRRRSPTSRRRWRRPA